MLPLRSPIPKQKPTSEAIEILCRRYFKDRPDLDRALDEERAHLSIAQAIYDLRTQAGLSQRGWAKRVGITASVICRLEDADYEGHSLRMLRHIAAALNPQVEVRFVRRPQPTQP